MTSHRDRKARASSTPSSPALPGSDPISSAPDLFVEQPAPDLPPEEVTAELVDPLSPSPDFAPAPSPPRARPRIGVSPEVAAGSGSRPPLHPRKPGSSGKSAGSSGDPASSSTPSGPGIPRVRSEVSALQPKLNHQLIEAVSAFVRIGVSPEVAAGSHGITRELFADWAERGRKQRKGIYRAFVEAMQFAADEFEVLAVARWNEQAGKDWRANAALLEATRPERFRPAAARGGSGAPGLPASTSGNPALTPAPIRIFLPPETVVRPAGSAESASSSSIAHPPQPLSSSSRSVPSPAESGGGIALDHDDDEEGDDDSDALDEEEPAPEAEAPAAE